MVIKVLLAHHGGLVRGALAAVLDKEDDIEVVAESAHGDNVLDLARRESPTIVVMDIDLPAALPMAELCAGLCELCPVLVLAERRSGATRAVEMAKLAPQAGLVATESSTETLIDCVRKLARGETVLDSDLARTALCAANNPLTEREREILRLASSGLTARAIASQLFLSHGTVRNHLSRVLSKTGGRTRIEAIRVAEESGWV